jgi:hypothetical protein
MPADASRPRFGALTPDGHHTETVSGVYLDLADPQPDAILLHDIAVGLSNVCRGGGQLEFFSVAEHAVLVGRRLRDLGEPPSVVLAGLHHDDPEAYIQDIVKPAKELIEWPRWVRGLSCLSRGPRRPYSELETRLWDAIRVGLDLGDIDIKAPVIKAADEWALAAECHHLRRSRGSTWYCLGAYDPAADPLQLGLAPKTARGLWLSEHARVIAEVARERTAARATAAAPAARPGRGRAALEALTLVKGGA